MQFVLVTGLSGSGKSVAMSVFEDIGFYCIDNMPPQLLLKFAEICKTGKIDRVAIAVDIRAGDMFSEILENTEQLKSAVTDLKVIYFEAGDEVLFKRFKETRRKHPLDGKFAGDLAGAIKYERGKLSSMREIADYCLDTTRFSNGDLRERLIEIFLEHPGDAMQIQVMSFGFKYGSAPEGDLVFDVRCLPNPFYIKELKPLTGLDEPIREFVLGFAQAQGLLERLKDLFDYLMPLYMREGKSRLVIAFGCTGGKHRSVVFAEETAKHLEANGYHVNKTHRDIKVKTI